MAKISNFERGALSGLKSHERKSTENGEMTSENVPNSTSNFEFRMRVPTSEELEKLETKRDSAPLERTITDKILRWLRQQDGCWCFKVAGSGGQMRGVPDIVGCFEGRFFALEVKRPKGGRLSMIQKHVIGLIADAGGIVGVVRSLEDVQRLLGGEHEQE